MDNPWDSFAAKYPVGTEIEGEVRNITEFGLFIGLEGDVDGMVHLSDIAWDKAGEEAITDYHKGSVVRAKVLDVDIEKERISLGIKQLSEDPFKAGMDGLKKGATVTCSVLEVTDGGLRVAVNDGIEGFIRRADLSRDRAEQRPERFSEGDRVDARLMSVDKNGRSVSLSIKALEIAEEKEAVAQYGSTDSGASLGDILGAALSKEEEEKSS